MDAPRLDALIGQYRQAHTPKAPPEHGFHPPVTVAVLTFHRDDPLQTILTALGGQTYDDFEVVVVDNAPLQSSAPSSSAISPGPAT